MKEKAAEVEASAMVSKAAVSRTDGPSRRPSFVCELSLSIAISLSYLSLSPGVIGVVLEAVVVRCRRRSAAGLSLKRCRQLVAGVPWLLSNWWVLVSCVCPSVRLGSGMGAKGVCRRSQADATTSTGSPNEQPEDGEGEGEEGEGQAGRKGRLRGSTAGRQSRSCKQESTGRDFGLLLTCSKKQRRSAKRAADISRELWVTGLASRTVTGL